MIAESRAHLATVVGLEPDHAGARRKLSCRKVNGRWITDAMAKADKQWHRSLGRLSRVTAIEPEKVQPIFHLDVADDADFFAGASAALVHDKTLPDLRRGPFDAPEAVAPK